MELAQSIPPAVGCQAPSVAPKAEAAPATEKKTVEIANIDGATFKMQLAANTALVRNGTLPRRAKPAKQAVMAATEPAKEEEAPAEVQAGQPSMEILQNGVNKERANSSMTPHAFEGLQERGVYSDKHSSRTCCGLGAFLAYLFRPLDTSGADNFMQ